MTTKRHDSTAWVACVVRCDTGVEGDAREGPGLGRIGMRGERGKRVPSLSAAFQPLAQSLVTAGNASSSLPNTSGPAVMVAPDDRKSRGTPGSCGGMSLSSR